jgi:hypothetical protein
VLVATDYINRNGKTLILFKHKKKEEVHQPAIMGPTMIDVKVQGNNVLYEKSNPTAAKALSKISFLKRNIVPKSFFSC